MKAHLTALATCLLAGAAVLAFSAPALAMSADFQAGMNDRYAWERWFNGLADGQYKTGAAFWASQRSLPHPTSCNTMQSSREFTQGCYAAKHELDPSDLRRNANPDYRAGWNVDDWSAPAYPAPQKPVDDWVVPPEPASAPHLTTTTTALLRYGKVWGTQVVLNGDWQVPAVIDTGAGLSCINHEALDRLFQRGSLTKGDYRRTETFGTAAGGADHRSYIWHINTLSVSGVRFHDVEVADCRDGDNLLGMNIFGLIKSYSIDQDAAVLTATILVDR
jgi:hypothetical protein